MVQLQGSGWTKTYNPGLSDSRARSPIHLAIPSDSWDTGTKEGCWHPGAWANPSASWFPHCEVHRWPSFGLCRLPIVPLHIWKMPCGDNTLKMGEKIRSRISPLPLLARGLARLLILRMSSTLQNICLLVLLGRQEIWAKVVWTDSMSWNININ